MVAALLPCLIASTLAAAPTLADAEAAFSAGRFDRLLEVTQHLVATDLPVDEKVRAYELLATAHAAFGHEEPAVDAFRRLLALKPSFQPGDELSPKLRDHFERARESVRPAPPEPHPAVSELATPPSEQPAVTPVYARWWFWPAVATVAAGAGAAWYFSRGPAVPAGTLGSEQLR